MTTSRGAAATSHCSTAKSSDNTSCCTRGPFTAEVVSLSVAPALQRRGIGTRLLDHAVRTARTLGFRRLEIGTGDTGFDQLRLYERCGFVRCGIDRGYFTRFYPAPVIENGLVCRDMVRRPQHGPRPPRTVSPLRIPRCGRLRGAAAGRRSRPASGMRLSGRTAPRPAGPQVLRRAHRTVRRAEHHPLRPSAAQPLRPRAVPPRTGGTCLHAPGPPGFPKIAFFPQSASCETTEKGRYLAVSAPPVQVS